MPQWLIISIWCLGALVIVYYVILNFIFLVLGRYKEKGGFKIFQEKLYTAMFLISLLVGIPMALNIFYIYVLK